MTYCKPNNAGLGSTDKAVGKKLADLLNALSAINAANVEGEIVNDMWAIRNRIRRTLEADGWIVSIKENDFVVKRDKTF